MARKRTKRTRALRTPKGAGQQRDSRRYLDVLRDDSGQIRSLNLAHAPFEADWQNRLVLLTAGKVHSAFEGAPSLAALADIAGTVATTTSRSIETLLAAAPKKTACNRGCSHCCHQSVGVSVAEVALIHSVVEGWSETSKAVLRERVATSARILRDPARHQLAILPCPFLDRGSCSVYEVRPLTCRGANSLDASACERVYGQKTGLPNAQPTPEHRGAGEPGGTGGIPHYLEPVRVAQAVAAGLQIALDESYGLDAAPLELTLAMEVILENPESAVENWLASGNAFRDARGGERAADQEAVRLLGLHKD